MGERVVVVGAGVIGLTCAVRLAEAGLDVDVLARDLPVETTSAVAGGLWLPDLVDGSDDVVRWSRRSLEVFGTLAGQEQTGVRLRSGHVVHRARVPPPSWAAPLADVVPLRADADPVPGFTFGWFLTVPLVDTRTYLEYLRTRLLDAGGTLTRLPLPALPRRGIVVNCTGLASRALASDPSVAPVRGQVVLLEDPGLKNWFVHEAPDDVVYVLPRGRDVVVGGTAQDGDWSTTPDPQQAAAILERAAQSVPQLRSATVLGHRVGLRPARPSVRLEVEHRRGDDDPDHVLVHCYGHGGSGVTLSWGCADDVLARVRDLVTVAR